MKRKASKLGKKKRKEVVARTIVSFYLLKKDKYNDIALFYYQTSQYNAS